MKIYKITEASKTCYSAMRLTNLMGFNKEVNKKGRINPRPFFLDKSEKVGFRYNISYV